MTVDIIEKLEERLSVLELKLELLTKLTKNEMNMSVDECKTMVEFAFVMDLRKDEYNDVINLLSTQINFYKSCSQKSYSTRQIPKFDLELDVFSALSKDEYENAIWKCIPKFNGNVDICEKIARINGIHDMFYGSLATEIKKTKNEKLDKEARLKNIYKDNKLQIDNLFKDVDRLYQELKSNIEHVDTIINFFTKNDLKKISNFYNGELWDKNNDDKKVAIYEESYIHNVCKTDNKVVLDQIDNILKDKKIEYNELVTYLVTETTSPKKVEYLQDFYITMNVYNKNEYILFDELLELKEKLVDNIVHVDELMKSYHKHVNSL